MNWKLQTDYFISSNKYPGSKSWIAAPIGRRHLKKEFILKSAELVIFNFS